MGHSGRKAPPIQVVMTIIVLKSFSKEQEEKDTIKGSFSILSHHPNILSFFSLYVL